MTLDFKKSSRRQFRMKMIVDLHSIDGVLPELTVILDRNIPEEFKNEEYVWCDIWHVFKSLRGFEKCLGLHM